MSAQTSQPLLARDQRARQEDVKGVDSGATTCLSADTEGPFLGEMAR